MNMNKLHPGERITSNGIIAIPSEQEYSYSYEENRTIGFCGIVAILILILVSSLVVYFITNPNLVMGILK